MSAPPLTPDPTRTAHEQHAAQKVARVALLLGILITLLKFGVFLMTNSAAVLGDALESIVNLVAAAMALLSTWYAAQPADAEHPYGHGKIEFVSVGVEGAMIIFAALTMIFESSRRLLHGIEPQRLGYGLMLLSASNVLMVLLAVYVWQAGRRLQSPTLIADGKHLMTDVVTTLAAIIGLALVWYTGKTWLDPVIGIAIAVLILFAGGHLLRESFGGLMDEADPKDDRAIRGILDSEVADRRILSYHKVRHRHVGSFHWVDMHIQVPAEMTVAAAHQLASEIEYRIETHLGRAKATAHVEPPA